MIYINDLLYLCQIYHKITAIYGTAQSCKRVRGTRKPHEIISPTVLPPVSLGHSEYLTSTTVLWGMSLVGSKPESGDRGGEGGVVALLVPLLLPPRPLRGFLLPVTALPGFLEFGGLCFQRENIPSGNSARVPLSFKLYLLADHCAFEVDQAREIGSILKE